MHPLELSVDKHPCRRSPVPQSRNDTAEGQSQSGEANQPRNPKSKGGGNARTGRTHDGPENEERAEANC